MGGLKFYRCNICGNVELSLIDAGVTPVCCGQDMEDVRANTEDVGTEKHVPVIVPTSNGVQIKIGSTEHPMLAEHRIIWIAVTDGEHVEIKNLHIDDKPEASFSIKPSVNNKVTAYAFCNLHGLWKAES